MMKSRKICGEQIVVFLFVALYTVGAILVSLHRFWQYDAFWYDFGILDETIWKLSRFQAPIIPTLRPPGGANVWGDHFNPSIILLSPLYWFTNRAEIMLIAQVVAVSLAAVVVWITAKKLVISTAARMALIVSFLGFIGMQNALYTDIHNIVFAVLPLTLTFWALFSKRYTLYWLFLFITLGCQESLAGVGIGLGLFILLSKERNIRLGIATIILSLIYGLVATKIIMPALSGHTYSYQPDIPLYTSEWITRFFAPMDLKLHAIFYTLLTFGFLPLLSLPTLPLIIGHYLERFVLNNAGTRWDLGLHYNALLSPIMAFASIEVLRRIQSIKKIQPLITFWAAGTIAAVFIVHRFMLHGPLMLATHPVFYEQTRRAVFLTNFVKKIPRGGLVMTANNLATHFTHGKVTLLSSKFEDIKPDVVALDIRAGQNANNFFPLSPDQYKDLIASLSASPNYRKEVIREDQLLFVRNNRYPANQR